MIHAIIVDDEPHSCKVLSTLLERYCAEVKVLAVCHSAEEGLAAIQQYQPRLVFLDVEMPRMNGFEMLEQLPEINFDLIFITSYDQYAIKAFRFSAVDYLLKPIDRTELQKAVRKVMAHSPKQLSQQLDILLQKINSSASTYKLALPTMEGLQIIPADDIVYCESDSNYTTIYLKNKQKVVVPRTLKEIEELLEDHPFVRAHHSYLVNLNEISKYVKGEGGYLVMNDGSQIDVSRSRRELLLKKLLPNKQ